MTIVVVSVPLSQAYLFPWALILNLKSKYWTSLWSLVVISPDLKFLVRFCLLLLSTSIGVLVLPPLLGEVPLCFP